MNMKMYHMYKILWVWFYHNFLFIQKVGCYFDLNGWIILGLKAMKDKLICFTNCVVLIILSIADKSGSYCVSEFHFNTTEIGHHLFSWHWFWKGHLQCMERNMDINYPHQWRGTSYILDKKVVGWGHGRKYPNPFSFIWYQYLWGQWWCNRYWEEPCTKFGGESKVKQCPSQL